VFYTTALLRGRTSSGPSPCAAWAEPLGLVPWMYILRIFRNNSWKSLHRVGEASRVLGGEEGEKQLTWSVVCFKDTVE